MRMQYFSEYKDAVDYITVTKGAYALIDPHNYMVSPTLFKSSAFPECYHRDTSKGFSNIT